MIGCPHRSITFLPARGRDPPALRAARPRRRSSAPAALARHAWSRSLLSLPLYFRFDGPSADYQFVEYARWMPGLGVGYHVGIDGISLLLVLLTTLLTPLALAVRVARRSTTA